MAYTLSEMYNALASGLTITVPRKELKELLLESGGRMLSHGQFCDVKSRHLGAGVYKVWLE